ncbi:hypothetical protein BTHE68_45560 [Burkholderia sp. THE68]|nr:hypothetical protein BTHE68_45560 [Burkholderia sp. THE68]
MSGRDLRLFGSGWKSATFFGLTGQSRALFPLESLNRGTGIVFDNSKIQVSATGRYAVLSVLRVGIVDPGPSGKPFTDSRQYCPVVDTTSGCILSNNTGDICGGVWDSVRDEWTVSKADNNSTQSMIVYQLSNAKEIWKGFLSANTNSHRNSLKDAVKDNLGVGNMLACESLNTGNVDVYRAIAKELNIEGAVAEAAILSNAISKFDGKMNDGHVSMTVNQKTSLFDEPDFKFITKSYLLKGDHVKIVGGKGDDWALIEYTTAKGKILTKWIPSKALN